MKYIPLLIVGMGMGACSPLPPPDPSASGPRRDIVGTGVPSIPSLLSQRERLSLTSPQVNALDSVARVWRVENDTLARRLREVWGDRTDPRAREGERARDVERARPVLRALVENNRRLTGGVEAILDPAQQQVACELQAEERGERPGGGRRPPGAERAGWPWCGVARQDATAAPAT